jgi:hypothetical protein
MSRYRGAPAPAAIVIIWPADEIIHEREAQATPHRLIASRHQLRTCGTRVAIRALA